MRTLGKIAAALGVVSAIGVTGVIPASADWCGRHYHGYYNYGGGSNGHFKAAAVNPITLVRGTFMEGGTKTGDIDNIFGGRLRAAFSFVFAPKIGALPQRLGCLLMAQSGRADMLNQCPLLGGKADIVSGACCIAR